MLNKRAGRLSPLCQRNNSMILLILVNILAHGFLLILSGRWWDDWCQFGQTSQELMAQALELGRPSYYYVVSFANLLPNGGYRVVVFLMFCLSSIFVYRILLTMKYLSEKDCLWISLLFAVIPVNDCRVLLSVFSYSVGHFFYWFAFYVLTLVIRETGWRHICLRVISIFLFLLSFTLNSNLFYYALVLLYILYQKASLKESVRYFDFVLAPIVFYAAKAVLFPPYGVYEGYNSLAVPGLLKSVILVWIAAADVLLQTAGSLHLAEIAAVALIFFIVTHRMADKNPNDCEKNASIQMRPARFYMITAIIGLVVLAIGLFPYVAVRLTSHLEISGVQGRDSMLAPLGISIVLFSAAGMLKKYRIRWFVLATILFTGILFFNTQYATYQKDHYRQTAFMQSLAEEPELENMGNILYLTESEPAVQATRFYSLNANAEQVFHNQTRFIMNGFDNLRYLDDINLKMWTERDYHMKEYDSTNKEIDAIILFDCDPDYSDLLKLKYLELSNQEAAFRTALNDLTHMDVLYRGTDAYNTILSN